MCGTLRWARIPGPMMYVPYRQAPFWGANVVVRSTLSLSSAAARDSAGGGKNR